MEETEAWKRLASAGRAVLVTIAADGRPRPVPIVFAVTPDRRVVTAVDDKPKTTRRLARLDDIDRDPRVVILADHYDDDWSQLWWVRAEGGGSVQDSVDTATEAALRERYPQYRDHSLGPWIVIEVERITGWASEPGGGESGF